MRVLQCTLCIRSRSVGPSCVGAKLSATRIETLPKLQSIRFATQSSTTVYTIGEAKTANAKIRSRFFRAVVAIDIEWALSGDWWLMQRRFSVYLSLFIIDSLMCAVYIISPFPDICRLRSVKRPLTTVVYINWVYMISLGAAITTSSTAMPVGRSGGSDCTTPAAPRKTGRLAGRLCS